MKNCAYKKETFLTTVQLYLQRFKISSSLVKGFLSGESNDVYKMKIVGTFFPATVILDHTRNTFEAIHETSKIHGSFSYNAKEIHFLYADESGVWECFSISFDYLRKYATI